MKMLLEAFLSGFGIATVVHFVVVPMSSRQVIVKQYAGYIGVLKAVLVAQRSYLQSMENKDMLKLQSDGKGKKFSQQEVASKDLKAKLVGLTTLHGKIHGDLPFAKREMAYGKLGPKDLDQVYTYFRNIFLPLIGLGSVADIFSRVSKTHHWDRLGESDSASEHTSDLPEKGEVGKDTIAEQEGWNEIMQTLHEPFESVSNAAIQGLEHVSYVLQFTKKPGDKKGRKSSTGEGHEDIEANIGKRPGDPKYGEHLESRLQEFSETRKAALHAFCALKGVDMDHIEDIQSQKQDKILEPNADGKNRQQLYLILYVGYKVHDSATVADKIAD